ncbi:nuclear transport factor 2 family protein [Nocardiopsis algeriensis]|uniref:DUF4440 domain-containing protein n=1 Tax=Nocardiopsis algeriensis TaxID=1478215 RepID=A0A841IY90_9ACTN|nr:nuclear transport factor 2 family protein [Nocardiopsis algeriensis]MBB6122246.1 hypothetical protein [Nocardiopsis algeriensis]
MDPDELLELEHRGWQALSDGTGAAFYGRLMTDDGVMVLAHGQVLDRQAVIASLDDAPPWRSYEIDEERVIPLGTSAAALVYRAAARRDTGSPVFRAWMSSTYVRRDGEWALASYTQTPIPDRPTPAGIRDAEM